MNLVGEFKKGVVEVKNRFDAIKEEESEEEVCELGDSDSDGGFLNPWITTFCNPGGLEGEEIGKKIPGEKEGKEEEIFIGDVHSENRRKMKVKFQVADVKKPLMAVKRIVENGNRVVFAESGSFIMTKLETS